VGNETGWVNVYNRHNGWNEIMTSGISKVILLLLLLLLMIDYSALIPLCHCPTFLEPSMTK
jgi:hypothetical protein